MQKHARAQHAHALHTYAEFCKHLIADSIAIHLFSVVPNYNSLIPPAPPMPTYETRPMDSGDRKPSTKYFSEDGRDGTKPVSVHRHSFGVCLNDQSRHIA